MSDLDLLAINTIRTLSIDAIQKANSGHPGLPMGAAPMAFVLWQRHLKFDPAEPNWQDRDRFVLSPGHGSMLLYSLLHLYGFPLPMEELQKFRQWESRTPGHPEFGHTAGVEATTGPLGQGSVNAIGMAIAERFAAQRLNRGEHKPVDHFTYALVSDGDLMEGLNYEGASLAGHLGLGRLIYLHDSNDISLDGPLELAFSEDTAIRYEAAGWHVQTVADGDTDLEGIDAAIAAAKAETAKPSLIIVKTTIGYGSPNKAGSSSSHGSPLGADEVAATKRALGWDPEHTFYVPGAVLEHTATASGRGAAARADWGTRFQAFEAAHPDLAASAKLADLGLLPEGWNEDLVRFEPGERVATRDAGGKVLNAIAGRLPWLLGGDADLSGSTKTSLKGEGDFHDQADSPARNVRFGVREHAMGAIANGIAYHGGARCFTATFFVFSDYMKPAIRLAAMNHLPVVFVFTHDSIYVGEDGPTHQPIEHLAALRAVPNLNVIRPCDAEETRIAWEVAIEDQERPTVLVLTRQKLETLDRKVFGNVEQARQGAYVLSESSAHVAAVTLVATGSEVHLALAAKPLLEAAGHATRVVSMPSQELFEDQEPTYRRSVLRDEGLTVSIEAGSTFGWERYTGRRGLTIGLDRYGASAPAEVIAEHLGLTPESVAERVIQALSAV